MTIKGTGFEGVMHSPSDFKFTIQMAHKSGDCRDPAQNRKKRVSALEGRTPAPCTATHGCYRDGGIQEEHMFPGSLSSM